MDNLLASILKRGDDAQFGRVLIRASFLEKMLTHLLDGYMVYLSGNLRQDLFDGKNAPLSTLSAKIDLCCALGLISVEQRTVLHHARKIRNVFAHADSHIHFDDDSFQQDRSLKGNPLKVSEEAFMSKTLELAEEILSRVEDAIHRKSNRVGSLLAK